MTEQMTPVESAAETVKTFNNLLAAKGLTAYVFDRLVGELRHGVIGIRPAGAANVFAKAVDREEYARSSSWSSADVTIGWPRTGSPKHLALLALVERMRAVEPAQPVQPAVRKEGEALYEDCDCECVPDLDEPDEPPTHYLRACIKCGVKWWSLHCPHDGNQKLCRNRHVNMPYGAPK